MEQKINVAELLKDCPKGMELDCAIYENVTLVEVKEGYDYPIVIETPNGQMLFSKYGCFSKNELAKCVIYPKGKTTWEGFVPPYKFKDGDILKSCNGNPFIFKQINSFGNAQCYCAINCYGELIFNSDNWTSIKNCRLVNEEEKQKLFDAIKSHGYKWNAYTKTLEKAIQPKFKVGDKVAKKCNMSNPVSIIRVGNQYYYLYNTEHDCEVLPIAEQDDWELVPDKFDVINFEPFMKVLARSDNSDVWECDFFSSYNPKCSNRFHCIGAWYNICIPYIGNEHLLGTTNDCDEYYKTWE